MLASWLALPPWKRRSSEESPDGLSQCQPTLLVAVNSRDLGKAGLVGAAAAGRTLPGTPPSSGWAGDTPGVAQDAWGTFPTAPCPGGPVGFGSVPMVQEGLVALQVSHLWSQELGTWDGECRKNPNCGKNPNSPPKSKQTLNCLSSREKTSTFWENLPLYVRGKA